MASHSARPHSHAPTSEPSAWIERFATLVPAEARVLDLACGHGRHARFFAARGANVVAVDRDATALAGLAGVARIESRMVDLESGEWPFAGEQFDAIVVTNYLHRPSLSALLRTLADDGVLLYETFAQGNEAYGRPTNPDFLLEPDELLRLADRRLTMIAFEQGVVSEPPPGAVVQRLAAVGLARPWPPSLPGGR